MLEAAKRVVKKLVQQGHLAYFAGGWVRDFLLNHPSDDIDIATSASIEEIQALFPKTIPVGIAFGIVIVVEEGHQFEVATFRKDGEYADGRRPTGVKPATAIEDAQRRDFTINGMFYDPLKDILHDFVFGQKDLEEGVIRAIGDPSARFSEDRLRMIRAVRYSTRFGFPIETQTKEAILTHAKSLLPAVAMERIWQELKKMAQFAHFREGLVMLHELQLLPTIFPELKSLSRQEICILLEPIQAFPKDAPLIASLLELFPYASQKEVCKLCEYLKLSKAERDFALFLASAKSVMQDSKTWQEKLDPVEWVYFYANPHSEKALQILGARLEKETKEKFYITHKRQRQTLAPHIIRIQQKTPLVTAHHLKNEGVLPGEKMGKLLKEAERLSITHNLNNTEDAIQIIKKTSLW